MNSKWKPKYFNSPYPLSKISLEEEKENHNSPVLQDHGNPLFPSICTAYFESAVFSFAYKLLNKLQLLIHLQKLASWMDSERLCPRKQRFRSRTMEKQTQNSL